MTVLSPLPFTVELKLTARGRLWPHENTNKPDCAFAKLVPARDSEACPPRTVYVKLDSSTTRDKHCHLGLASSEAALWYCISYQSSCPQGKPRDTTGTKQVTNTPVLYELQEQVPSGKTEGHNVHQTGD